MMKNIHMSKRSYALGVLLIVPLILASVTLVLAQIPLVSAQTQYNVRLTPYISNGIPTKWLIDPLGQFSVNNVDPESIALKFIINAQGDQVQVDIKNIRIDAQDNVIILWASSKTFPDSTIKVVVTGTVSGVDTFVGDVTLAWRW